MIIILLILPLLKGDAEGFNIYNIKTENTADNVNQMIKYSETKQTNQEQSEPQSPVTQNQ